MHGKATNLTKQRLNLLHNKLFVPPLIDIGSLLCGYALIHTIAEVCSRTQTISLRTLSCLMWVTHGVCQLLWWLKQREIYCHIQCEIYCHKQREIYCHKHVN